MTIDLVPILDTGRLLIEVGPAPGPVGVFFHLRVTVEPRFFGGSHAQAYLDTDLEGFADALDAAPIEGTCRIGGGRSMGIVLRSLLVNGVGPDLAVECTIERTDDDPQESLRFLEFGVEPFARTAASKIRSVLSTDPWPTSE